MTLTDTNLFGVRVFASDPDTAGAAILDLALQRLTGLVCVANVDMVTRAKRDRKLRTAMGQARLVVTDGLPLVWMLHRLGHVFARRVYGPDLMVDLCRRFDAAGLPIFLYGGTQVEIDALMATLQSRFPTLQIAGAVAPGMLAADPPCDEATARLINQSGARIVFVGLGCPKQEYWMLNHSQHVGAITIGVGLAFAQIAGLKRRAPSWMSDAGLEWLHRLAQEPRRLWRRYLIGNSLFIWYCARELGSRWFRI